MLGQELVCQSLGIPGPSTNSNQPQLNGQPSCKLCGKVGIAPFVPTEDARVTNGGPPRTLVDFLKKAKFAQRMKHEIESKFNFKDIKFVRARCASPLSSTFRPGPGGHLCILHILLCNMYVIFSSHSRCQ